MPLKSTSAGTMTKPPPTPKIYHITHLDNLPRILSEGALLSDRLMEGRQGPTQGIGMTAIKQRRLNEILVPSHPGTTVGDFVPFYFCPRSVMLSVFWYDNAADLTYHGGQGPIVHLEADLAAVVAWADANRTRWAFSLSNAGSYYVQFRFNLAELDALRWTAIMATDFRETDIKEAKQAEFLLYGRFPWELVQRVGVISPRRQELVAQALAATDHRPPVSVMPLWYFTPKPGDE